MPDATRRGTIGRSASASRSRRRSARIACTTRRAFRPSGSTALAGHDHAGKGPRNYRRSDRRIAEDVSDLLTDDDFLDASNIEVAVDAGEVLLQGTVDSRADKRRAEDLALSIKGVTDVRNSLRLEDGNTNTTPLAFGDGR
jgi:osmotically-inducible protein OsmY